MIQISCKVQANATTTEISCMLARDEEVMILVERSG